MSVHCGMRIEFFLDHIVIIPFLLNSYPKHSWAWCWVGQLADQGGQGAVEHVHALCGENVEKRVCLFLLVGICTCEYQSFSPRKSKGVDLFIHVS